MIFVGTNKPEQQPNNELTNNIITPSVPTSPLTMTCPTPAHSPAPLISKLQTKASTEEAPTRFSFEEAHIQKSDDTSYKFLNKKLSPKFQRITKQIVNNLPQIPKYKKTMKFPMVRRTTEASPAVPKLSSMEIFNPETDDLDSDSSEPSSPDSIDSVISVPKTVKIIENDVSSHSFNNLENVEGNKLPIEKLNTQVMVNGQLDDVNNYVNRKHLVDFAEQLSAQLLKELDVDDEIIDNIDEDVDRSISDIINDKQSIFNLDDPYIKKLNGEMKDLNLLREELRERRLMLANLNMHQYQGNSTSSTIKEEDEFSPKNEPESDEHRVISNYDMALLIEEETENEIDDDDKFDGPKTSGNVKEDVNSSDDHDDDDQKFCQDDIASIINSNDNLNVSLSSQQSLNISNASSTAPGLSNFKRKRSQQRSSESKDSWPHSNSTASLDSPSVGGSSTHHRYYHVFREGELDALINHHVASLHIVSSYYERASWCVVAEKVQVWTI